MHSIERGYVVLLTTVILSFAGILYTSNMVSLQIIDNKVLGNYYRNNEAFTNAESGINLILNKLNSIDVAKSMLTSLPFTYPEHTSSLLYKVEVNKINHNKLSIVSIGTSSDKSASRQVSLEVYHYFSFNIPKAPLLSNGKLTFDDANSINDGCEGLSMADCRSPGNISKDLMISQPSKLVVSNEERDNNALLQRCALPASVDNINVNVININALQGQLEDAEGNSRIKEVINGHWGKAEASTGDVFEQVSSIANLNNAGSLFESTFGSTWEQTKSVFINNPLVADIDMTFNSDLDCSQQLQSIEQHINIIYIKGNCNIRSSDLSTMNTFSVGSSDAPKMVLIEGGQFITPNNANVTINGLLYLIPQVNDLTDSNGEVIYIDGIKQTHQEKAINLAGVNVQGALLSEYDCSISLHDSTSDNHKSVSIRYDNNKLNRLYEQIGMSPSASYYQLVAGSWRDF